MANRRSHYLLMLMVSRTYQMMHAAAASLMMLKNYQYDARAGRRVGGWRRVVIHHFANLVKRRTHYRIESFNTWYRNTELSIYHMHRNINYRTFDISYYMKYRTFNISYSYVSKHEVFFPPFIPFWHPRFCKYWTKPSNVYIKYRNILYS